MTKTPQMYYKQNRLKKLRAFCHASRTGSISEAAEQLFLSQPTVTLQIQALERELDTVLFERRGPKIQLTPEGKLLYEFIPNTNHVPIKSTLMFFLIFQVVDFYYEDGFIGMISQWVMYWSFSILAYFLTHNINFYKNYMAYKKQ